jgi:hypothetical protein
VDVYCALNCFSPLVTAVRPTLDVPIKTTAKGENRPFFSLRFTMASRRVLIASSSRAPLELVVCSPRARLSSSSSRARWVLSSPLVALSLSLALWAGACVLSGQSSSHFLSTLATAADVLPLRKISLHSRATFYFPGMWLSWVLFVDLRLHPFRTRREAGRCGVCARLRRETRLLVRLLNSFG